MRDRGEEGRWKKRISIKISPETKSRLHRADGLRAPVPHLPDGPQWLFEIKLDGYRAIAVKSDRGVNLFSRRHKSFNHHYPHIVEALGELPEGTVVDGEPPQTARYKTLQFRS